MSDLTQSVAWQNLLKHKSELAKTSLTELILADPQRLENCQLKVESLRLNYVLQYMTPQTLDLLLALARQQKVEDERSRMWRGEKINVTENRAALHIALRQKSDQPIWVDGQNVIPEIRAVREKMAHFAEQVRKETWKGANGKSIKHIVNIGIGGSDLGPRFVVKALGAYETRIEIHFVANADAADLLSVVKDLDPGETLFVVVSKTFTTQETLLNARAARKWLIATLGEEGVPRHFVAVSTNLKAVVEFGIHQDNIFPMRDWVGGRYSLWSAVGLSIMLAIGVESFNALCDGAAAMDTHFHDAPLQKNMPVIMALLGIWQRNFLDAGALAILPYSERLSFLPDYLQQLDMESNGKSVTRDGKPVDYGTSPLIFGERGTVGQHSFHQWLHQGSDKVACDFIGVVEDDLNYPEQHRVMLANMTAQASALAFGRPQAPKPEEIYRGGRSSNLLLMQRLDPYTIGLLLALYEHKVFVQAVIWNINSFDQPGVELGKQMARALESAPAVTDKQGQFTASLLGWISKLSTK